MNSISRNLSIASAVAFISLYALPFSRFLLPGNLFRIFGISLLIIWLVTSKIYQTIYKFSTFVKLILVQLFILYLTVFIEFGNIKIIIVGYTAFWSFLVIFEHYRINNDLLALKTITITSILVILLTSITTILISLRIPNASKIHRVDDLSGLSGSELMYRYNIGGFDFINGLCIAMSLFIFLGFKYKEKFLFITGILGMICIFMSGYTIATILLLTGFVLILFAKKNGTFKVFQSIATLAIVIILVSVFKNSVNLIGGVETKNEHLASRLYELQDFLNNSLSSGADLSYRQELMRKSFSTFIKNPVIGVGPYYFEPDHGVGNHSQALDDLARYGLVGMIYYIFVIISFLKWFANIKESTESYYSLLLPYILFMFLSFLNPTLLLPTLGMILFCTIPGMYYTYYFYEQ